MSEPQDNTPVEPPLGDMNKLMSRNYWFKLVPFMFFSCLIIYIIFFMPYGAEPDGTIFGEGLKKVFWFVLTPTPTPMPTPVP